MRTGYKHILRYVPMCRYTSMITTVMRWTLRHTLGRNSSRSLGTLPVQVNLTPSAQNQRLLPRRASMNEAGTVSMPVDE